jgi:hypothetical protein
MESLLEKIAAVAKMMVLFASLVLQMGRLCLGIAVARLADAPARSHIEGRRQRLCGRLADRRTGIFESAAGFATRYDKLACLIIAD